MAEQFLIRLVNGPCPGDLFTTKATWPLPDELLPTPNGVYRKTSESQLPPQSEDSHILRGAAYHWCAST